MPTDVFHASRWTSGNHLFPTVIEVSEKAVTLRNRSWFTRDEISSNRSYGGAPAGWGLLAYGWKLSGTWEASMIPGGMAPVCCQGGVGVVFSPACIQNVVVAHILMEDWVQI